MELHDDSSFISNTALLAEIYTPTPTIVYAEYVVDSIIGDGPGSCEFGSHHAGNFDRSQQCAALCTPDPRCLGFIFGLSGGIGCCYLKAYFPPNASSSTTSGYTTYVKGTAGEALWFACTEKVES